MHLHSEDPRITAYVLGELEPDEAAAVERAAAEDPLIREKIREATEIQHFLKERLTTPTRHLLPRQRENIRRSAIRSAGSGQRTPLVSLGIWLIPAAAVIALGAIFLTRMPDEAPTPVAAKPAEPVVPQPEIVVPAAPIPPPAPARPAIARHGSVAAADFPSVALPVTPGKPFLTPITRPVLEEDHLPQPAAVRLEEILNSFQLRLNGTTAIARSTSSGWHPDNRDSGVSAPIATLTTEMIACPWKPSSALLLVSLRTGSQKDCAVRLTFHADPANVSRYRVLGFDPEPRPTTQEIPTTLPAGSYATFAIEIEPSTADNHLGSLEWSTDDLPAPTITLLRKTDAEPSDDARFAALVCTYSQWLAGDPNAVIDKPLLAALSRETASITLAADRADFLKLIDHSLQF